MTPHVTGCLRTVSISGAAPRVCALTPSNPLSASRRSDANETEPRRHIDTSTCSRQAGPANTPSHHRTHRAGPMPCGFPARPARGVSPRRVYRIGRINPISRYNMPSARAIRPPVRAIAFRTESISAMLHCDKISQLTTNARYRTDALHPEPERESPGRDTDRAAHDGFNRTHGCVASISRQGEPLALRVEKEPGTAIRLPPTSKIVLENPAF